MASDGGNRSARLDPSSSEERLDFKVAVLALDGGCVVHDYPTDCEDGLEAHHALSQQQLRHAGRHDLLWDPRVGIALCGLAHRRHHAGTMRVPRDRLPARVLEVAAEAGLSYLLDRYYPAEAA